MFSSKEVVFSGGKKSAGEIVCFDWQSCLLQIVTDVLVLECYWIIALLDVKHIFTFFVVFRNNILPKDHIQAVVTPLPHLHLWSVNPNMIFI